ncbi:hypothetical protein UFOVP75_58 [uncultured Caudovirales phage]|uniref:Uncharacterized protein n=1 Tax=uncultured Caudovirales phage TaxID=2100421 RepID=A0A6J5KX51_9CAUD|nr:hypothetical protein UFOVP75_58 [uncultured Caudovirales phage]
MFRNYKSILDIPPEVFIELYNKHNLKPTNSFIEVRGDKCDGIGVVLYDMGIRSPDVNSWYTTAENAFGMDISEIAHWGSGFDDALLGKPLFDSSEPYEKHGHSVGRAVRHLYVPAVVVVAE